MKKKQIIRPPVKKKRKIKWWNVFITAFTIVLLGGFMVWMMVYTYQQEKHENEIEEKYNASLPLSGVALDHKLVCMVNNTYLGVDQIPVIVQSKTYYGCCQKCVQDLNSDETVRFAVDTYSKATVDKALAFRTMNPNKPGTILYFESELNAKLYLKK
ncbi:MAG: hypothetical protein AABY93_05450 [Bacteroidota bacterium]